MKESLVWVWFVVLLQIAAAKETKLLIDLMKHSITTPRFTDNPIYKVTNADYSEGPGELTEEGILKMQEQGVSLQNSFISDNKFLPDKFLPENFYHKTYSDEPSVMSAYSSMLGTYPESIAWTQHVSIDSSSNLGPFERDDELQVRRAMRLTDSPSKLTTRDITVWSEEEGRTFFNDPSINCPQLQRDFDSNLDLANKKYSQNGKYDDLYEDMSETFGIPQDKIDFKTAHLYLDDYITAKANGKQTPKFLEPGTTESLIKNYYKDYEYEGKYGPDTSNARVVSNNFFNYVMTSMYGKTQVDKGTIQNDHYSHLKYAQFIGNENALVAATKMLDIPVTRDPDFGSTLRFELYEAGGENYVKTTYEGKPVAIGGANDGIMKYDAFMKLLYQRLYFGNVNNYCKGQENIAANSYSKFDSYDEYLKSQHSEFRVAATTAKPIASSSTSTVTTSSSTSGSSVAASSSGSSAVTSSSRASSSSSASGAKAETTLRSSNSKDGWFSQGFVEVEQKATGPKVVEVVEPIVVERPRVVQTQLQSPPIYQPRVSAPVREPIMYERPVVQTYSAPAPAVRAPVAYSGGYEVSGSSARVIDVDFKKKAGWDRKPDNKCITKAPYDPRNTHECKVDIPYLHAVDLPQVIHDRQVIVVPDVRVEEKVRVQEKVVTEKPTEIHHIRIDNEPVAIAAPTMFAETIHEESGWPWWWWIPLLLL